jgi:argininosuccinate lyase
VSEKFPAQGYKDNVLSDCFADAQRYLLDHYLDVDRAHVLMLAEQGIISQEELATILRAIESLDVRGDSRRRIRWQRGRSLLFYSA